MWGLFSAMVSFMHNTICPPEMERKPLKTACGCPCGRVTKRVTHSQSPRPLECMYSYVYQMTPGVFSCRMQHLQLMCLKNGGKQHTRSALYAWISYFITWAVFHAVSKNRRKHHSEFKPQWYAGIGLVLHVSKNGRKHHSLFVKLVTFSLWWCSICCRTEKVCVLCSCIWCALEW